MTESQKIEYVRQLTEDNETDDAVLSLYLSIAGEKIIDRAFPYDDSIQEVPRKYEMLQCEIATYLLNKRGAEGQTSHTENGITRSYERADVPTSMLRTIIPRVGVFKSTESE